MQLKYPVVLLMLMFLLTFALASSAFATTYYVAKNGSNANTGLGPDSGDAWLTIVYANSQISGGDTVLIRTGTYSEMIANLPSGIGVGSETTFKNYNDETVVMNGNGSSRFIIQLIQSDYIKIQGLIFDGGNCAYDPWLIRSDFSVTEVGVDLSVYNIIDSCEFRNVTRGGAILGGGNHSKITNNYFHDINTSSQTETTWQSYPWYTANTEEVEFAYNTIDHIGGFGLSVYSAPTYGGARWNKIHHNIIHDCGWSGSRVAAGIILSGSSGNYVYNNIVYGCGGWGIQACSRSDGDFIYNNTVFDNNKRNASRGGIGIGGSSCTMINDPTLRNNISYANNGGDDIYIGLYSGTLINTNNLTTNPYFADIENEDFHLTSNSTGAIDQGYDLTGIVDDDFDNIARPQGSSWDIGAYEYIDIGAPVAAFSGTPTKSQPYSKATGYKSCAGKCRELTQRRTGAWISRQEAARKVANR